MSVDSAAGEVHGESESSSISADGRIVAFQSWASDLVPGDTNGTADVFVRDRFTGTTTRVSVSTSGEQANSYSLAPSVSGLGHLPG